MEERFSAGEAEARRAAARYCGVRARDVALTDSTTMSIALTYHGIRLREG